MYVGARGKHPPARYDREHPLQHQPGPAGAGGQGGPGHHRQGGRDRGGHQEAGDQPEEDRGRDCGGGDDDPQAQGRHLGEGCTQQGGQWSRSMPPVLLLFLQYIATKYTCTH